MSRSESLLFFSASANCALQRYPCSCNWPIGTKGFSLVFRRNFSLKVSSLTLGSGLKPSISGGWEKSNGRGPGGNVWAVCSGTAGAGADAMLTLGWMNQWVRRGTEQVHIRLHFDPNFHSKGPFHILNIKNETQIKYKITVTRACTHTRGF